LWGSLRRRPCLLYHLLLNCWLILLSLGPRRYLWLSSHLINVQRSVKRGVILILLHDKVSTPSRASLGREPRGRAVELLLLNVVLLGASHKWCLVMFLFRLGGVMILPQLPVDHLFDLGGLEELVLVVLAFVRELALEGYSDRRRHCLHI
jgi:hypothetical protein